MGDSKEDWLDTQWIWETADVKTCPHGYVFKVYCKVCADPATYEAFKRERDNDPR